MNPFSPPKQNHESQASQGIMVDLLELVYRLLDRWKLIVATALLGAFCMLFYSTVIAQPLYRATSKLYVLSSRDSAINLSDLQIGSYLTADYREVFELWEVHEMVMQNLGLDYSYGKLNQMVSVSNPSNTRMLNITVTSSDPKEAAALANEYAAVAQQYISDTMKTDAPSLMSQALVPGSPYTPNKTRNVILGTLLGALLMTFVQALLFILDDKIKTSDDIARYLDLPTLAVIAHNDFAGAADPSRRSVKPQKGGSVHA